MSPEPDVDSALGRPTPAPRGGKRDSIRRKPGIGQLYRVFVFLLGLLFIAAGIALAVLPGPLTIPPVLLGLWIWSTEFAWAKSLFEKFGEKGREAWEHAKAHPVSSSAITIGGLLAAGAAAWAVGHYGLVEEAKTAVGL